MATLDSRADEIANWELAQQENLLQKLVTLNYQRSFKKALRTNPATAGGRKQARSVG